MSLTVQFRHQFASVSFDIAFDSPTPGVIAFFGPSGCGKSTIITAITGLLRPDSGRIAIDDTVLLDTETGIDVAPERRRIGLVFQDAVLFPHLTVLTNLRYGLRRAPPGSIGLDEVVDLLGIEALLTRRPRTLSGGERQRVAIGRALLSQPRVLAMDEPLAALDGPRKAEILPFLARLKTRLALPILYVTHALEEIASLADTLVLLNAGRVVAAGPLPELASRVDLPIADRDDAAAVLIARVTSHSARSQLSVLDCGGATILVPLLAQPVGSTLRLRVPARDVILATDPPGASSVQNALPGTVRAVTTDTHRHVSLVEVILQGSRLLARVTPEAVDRLELVPGRPVFALVKAVSIETLPG
jgi:molybdate transport system ATP-binding protein